MWRARCSFRRTMPVHVRVWFVMTCLVSARLLLLEREVICILRCGSCFVLLLHYLQLAFWIGSMHSMFSTCYFLHTVIFYLFYLVAPWANLTCCFCWWTFYTIAPTCSRRNSAHKLLIIDTRINLHRIRSTEPTFPTGRTWIVAGHLLVLGDWNSWAPLHRWYQNLNCLFQNLYHRIETDNRSFINGSLSH